MSVSLSLSLTVCQFLFLFLCIFQGVLLGLFLGLSASLSLSVLHFESLLLCHFCLCISVSVPSICLSVSVSPGLSVNVYDPVSVSLGLCPCLSLSCSFWGLSLCLYSSASMGPHFCLFQGSVVFVFHCMYLSFCVPFLCPSFHDSIFFSLPLSLCVFLSLPLYICVPCEVQRSSECPVLETQVCS